MNPQTIKVLAAIAALAVAFGMGFVVNGWRLSTKLAEKDTLIATLEKKAAEHRELAGSAVSDSKQALEVKNETDAVTTRKTLDRIVRDSAGARAASGQLREQAITPATATACPGATAPAPGSSSSAPAGVVSAELWISTEDEALELGQAADTAYERGLACERAADGYRAEALKLSDQLRALDRAQR